MKIRIFWRNPEVSIIFSYFFMNFINYFFAIFFLQNRVLSVRAQLIWNVPRAKCYHSIEIIARVSNSRVMLYEMCFALYLVS